VTLLVDTSVWSLAFRRDTESRTPQVAALQAALNGGESVVTTGLILQELLQGFSGARAHKELVQRFAALPLIVPDRRDYIDAADLRNLCRRSGIQLRSIDALLVQLCTRHDLTMLTTDNDFSLAAEHCHLKVWKALR